MTLPAKFVERVLRDLGEQEGRALCAALDTEPPVSVRLNPAKAGRGASADAGCGCRGTDAGPADPGTDGGAAARVAGVAAPVRETIVPDGPHAADTAPAETAAATPAEGTVAAAAGRASMAFCNEGTAPAGTAAAAPAEGTVAVAAGWASMAFCNEGTVPAGTAGPSIPETTATAGTAPDISAEGAVAVAAGRASMASCNEGTAPAGTAGPYAPGTTVPDADKTADAQSDAADACFPALEIAGRVPWCREGRYLAVRPQFTLDPDFHAGAYYVQEPSSQFVGHLLGGVRTEGARILDLCAAPGGKTTLYASLAGPDGLVVANEIDRRRASVLADNVRKWGTGNAAVTCCDPRALGDFEAWFDIVAVDAPCSGEGMFRKDPAARAEWSEGSVKLCAARQDGILREAWRALRPGGTLVYSTCTFNRDENEGSLERMLAWAGDEVAESDEIAVEPAWGLVPGRVGAFRTFRFYPHRTCGEGFFAAVARKSFDAAGRVRTPRARRAVIEAVDRTTVGELSRWVREPGRMRFGAVADTCYAWYEAQADAVKTLSGALPVIYSGTALGQMFRGRLKPDPALALFAGLDRGAVPVAKLSREDTLRYLRRQQIEAGGLVEGINLVCARGRALGFAKRIGARVNNLYPNSLRIIKQQR